MTNGIKNVIIDTASKIKYGDNKPKIKYTETKEENTGIFGLGGKATVIRDKEMTTGEYFQETSKALGTNNENTLAEKLRNFGGVKASLAAGIFGFSGNNSDEGVREYDQESINNAMWATGDSNNDGYVDNDELYQLYYSTVTGKESGSSVITPLAVAGGLASIVGAALADKLQNDGSLTSNQAQAIFELYKADEGIDANGDGFVSRDEFDALSVNHILTGYEKAEEQQQQQEQ